MICRQCYLIQGYKRYMISRHGLHLNFRSNKRQSYNYLNASYWIDSRINPSVWINGFIYTDSEFTTLVAQPLYSKLSWTDKTRSYSSKSRHKHYSSGSRLCVHTSQLKKFWSKTIYIFLKNKGVFPQYPISADSYVCVEIFNDTFICSPYRNG